MSFKHGQVILVGESSNITSWVTTHNGFGERVNGGFMAKYVSHLGSLLSPTMPETRKVHNLESLMKIAVTR